MEMIATVQSERAARYMTALCHHFGRKTDAGCVDTRGWVQFPFGRCDMTITDHELRLHAQADDEDALEQVIQIVTSHLDRFAFRENPDLNWRLVKASRPFSQKGQHP